MAQRKPVNPYWYQLCRCVIRMIGIVLFRLRHSGLERVPQTGPVLLVANHQSHLDPPLIGVGSRRPMNFVARKTLFDHQPLGWFIRSVGAFPLDRDGAGIGGVKETLRLLKAGEMVLIFPEGTRTADGEIAPFKAGFATLAIRSKCTILPVAIEGAYDAWPRDRKLPRPGTVHVHFGEPISPDEAAGFGDAALVAEIERRVRACRDEILRSPHFAARKAKKDG